MAGQRNQVLNEWYNANKQYIQMPDYGWEICDEIMSKVPEHYDFSFKGTRGKLDESFGNSGYVGQSKSVRAFAAEEEEKYPASECDKLLGVRSGATKAVLLPSEWHHTGSYYKETDYYDIRLLLAIKNNDEEVMSEYNEDEIKEAKQKYEDLKQWKKPELQSNTYKADVEWLTKL